MNVFLLVVGIVLGIVSRRWSNRTAVLVVVVVSTALLWGALIADTILAGTLWAAVNLAVGVGIAILYQWTMTHVGDGPIGRR